MVEKSNVRIFFLKPFMAERISRRCQVHTYDYINWESCTWATQTQTHRKSKFNVNAGGWGAGGWTGGRLFFLLGLLDVPDINIRTSGRSRKSMVTNRVAQRANTVSLYRGIFF